MIDLHRDHLSVLPTHTTYIMTYMAHINLSNMWSLERRFIKSSELVRLKTHSFRQWNPEKPDPKSQETRSPMRHDISIFVCGILASGDLAGRPTLPCLMCSLFLFNVSTWHWGNNLIPVSFLVCFGRGRDRSSVLHISPFLWVWGWCVGVYVCTRVHTFRLHG